MTEGFASYDGTGPWHPDPAAAGRGTGAVGGTDGAAGSGPAPVHPPGAWAPHGAAARTGGPEESGTGRRGDRAGHRDRTSAGSEAESDLARTWAALVATARRTADTGLVVGTSGNVSARVGDLVLVTPSAVPYDRLTPDDLTAVGLDGHRRIGRLPPTSEVPLHLALYRHTSARAVVHTHAVHATAVSALLTELPPVHYMAAALGGPVRVAPYALYGTAELARNMLTAMTGRTACLLQNHGTVAVGATLDEAYDRTAQLEWMCRLWLTASSIPGRTPRLLTPAELAEAADRFRTYGRDPAAPDG
jgi:L-fuculose-phosphate aldolase